MNFGYSVGDFIATGALAWKVYKSCKGAPESFGEISSEVLSLHAVLKEAEESVFARPLSLTKQERVKAVGDGCRDVLIDLDNLVVRYRSLGTQTKRTWDRMRWGTEDITGLRARLTSNTVLLTALISTSQANVEKKLDDFLQEIRAGKRPRSVISAQTTDSLCKDEKEVWRTIRKELEDIGITVDAFAANKAFILEWFANAMASGAFEENSLDDSKTTDSHEDSSDDPLNVAQIAPPNLTPSPSSNNPQHVSGPASQSHSAPDPVLPCPTTPPGRESALESRPTSPHAPSDANTTFASTLPSDRHHQPTKVSDDSVSAVPVPFLQIAAAAAISIVKTAEQARGNKADFELLAAGACDLVYIAFNSYKAQSDGGHEVSYDLEAELRGLVKMLTRIDNFGKNLLKRNELKQTILSNRDARRIKEFREKLNQALNRFLLRSNIQLRQDMSFIAKQQVVIQKDITNVAQTPGIPVPSGRNVPPAFHEGSLMLAVVEAARNNLISTSSPANTTFSPAPPSSRRLRRPTSTHSDDSEDSDDSDDSDDVMDVSLAISGFTLTALQFASQAAPTPFLQTAASSALSIVKSAECTKVNKDDFECLATDVCDMVYVVLNVYKTQSNDGHEVSDDLEDELKVLIRILTRIDEFGKKQRKRRVLERTIFSNRDAGTIKEFREKLNQALNRFLLQSNIQVHRDMSFIAKQQVVIQKDITNVAQTPGVPVRNGQNVPPAFYEGTLMLAVAEAAHDNPISTSSPADTTFSPTPLSNRRLRRQTSTQSDDSDDSNISDDSDDVMDVSLAISGFVLTTLQYASQAASVPFLQTAAASALSIVKSAEQARGNKDDFERLAADVCDMVYVVLNMYKTQSNGGHEVSDDLEDELKVLIRTLTRIDEFGKKQRKRNVLEQTIFPTETLEKLSDSARNSANI